jgi:alcohol dehydrogenase class IV
MIPAMVNETAFELAASNIRFGAGVTREVGMDLVDLGARRVLLVTDPTLSRMAPVQIARESIESAGLTCVVYDRGARRAERRVVSGCHRVRQRQSLRRDRRGRRRIGDRHRQSGEPLYDLPTRGLSGLRQPAGRQRPAGAGSAEDADRHSHDSRYGSETTGVSIFDYRRLHAKTGIANRRLKPTLGLLDPDNTKTMPPQVAASTGLDILSHAVESFTAMSFAERPRPDRPAVRPAYQGSNPISDVWSLQALRMVADYITRAVDDPTDDEARANMLLAASYAGVGFGNAGVHLPHGMSYPVSGHVKTYCAPGYTTDHPLVPHGMSVILNAPAVFASPRKRIPSATCKRRRALGADVSGVRKEDAGKVLADRITWFHAAIADAERPPRDWLLVRRHPGARRGHAAAASGDEAVASPRRTGRTRRLVRRRDGRMVNPSFAQELERVVGRDRILRDPNELIPFESDGLAKLRSRPGVVVLPENAAEVQAVVRCCHEHGVPFVARGSGTGLSGGALPHPDGVLIVLTRLNRILDVDIPNQRITVEPGVINLEVTRRVSPLGFYYAPDPSSQLICSIGGNIAENSGGAHCLKYGFTVHHVLAAEVVLPNGDLVQIGSAAVDAPGLDLLGVIVGSEGTLGVVTKATLRILRIPEAVRTLLAAFPSTEAAGNAVSDIISAGIIPRRSR